MLAACVTTACFLDVQEAKLRGTESMDEGVVVPLVMQNKPPAVEGREDDELADVELRPEQVHSPCNVSHVHVRYHKDSLLHSLDV